MEPATRTFVVDKSLYGNIARSNTFGLSTFSPFVRLDNNKLVAYFGKNALSEVVDATTAKTVEGSEVPLPLDVKLTGYQYLSQMGIPANQQEAAMEKWLKLPESLQTTLMSQWAALDKSDTQAVQTFITGVLASLN